MDGKPCLAAMASKRDIDVTKLKGSKISVTVDDALIDVLVVSFHAGSKIYQGALLDISKKDAPYGIVPPSPPKVEDSVAPCGTEGQEEKVDKLHSLKQRHTYYQIPPGTHVFIGRYSKNTKDKSVRMRRLRPRKILCSHCQGEFNDDDPTQKKGVLTRTNSNQNTQLNPNRNDYNKNQNTRVLTRSSRSDSADKNGESAENSENSNSKTEDSRIPTEDKPESKVLKIENSEPEECVTSCNTLSSMKKGGEKMVLRKRKMSFPGSLRNMIPADKQKRVDIVKTEECVTEGTNKAGTNTTLKPSLAKTSPIIKISYANPQGTDTVVEISPRLQVTSDTEEEASGWSVVETSDSAAEKNASAKAAKKALKKAKKEAQRKASVIVTHNQENGTESLNAEKDRHHHHKHKVKKKRKHKDDEETDKCNSENTDTRNMFNVGGGNDGWCLRTNYSNDNVSLVHTELNKTNSVFEDVKNKCLHQKLSISLKRLNAKAYMRCSPKYSIEEDSIISDISDASSASVGSADGSEYSDVPDFPKHTSPLRDMDKVKPLMMRISTHSVKKCVLDIGREMAVGDIVWGKIHGFPWWPGKVLALTISQRDSGATINQQAHVSWFGSSTSSYMPCNQLTPFLEEFKLRYNKKKRGPYKEAIRQAWHEANVSDNNINDLNLVTT